MEGLAARLAAQHASRQEIALLLDMIAEDESLTEPKAQAQANKRFHRQLHLSSHNRYLIETLGPIRRSLSLLGGTTFEAPGRMESSNAEHRLIIDAVAARDADAAEAAARQHIISAYEVRLRLEAAR